MQTDVTREALIELFDEYHVMPCRHYDREIFIKSILALLADRDGWRPIESAPVDDIFIAAIRVRHTNGDTWWERHLIWLDDETGDLHPDCEQGWSISDYELWCPALFPELPPLESGAR
ncbi:hypothetical protein [Sphingomonas sp. SRS2]|uniref:hypothetical protein n=1 Tax=Sphingomonas sp. SRS2 TaxID=133190 RepID=UPI0006184922|nr:hypothetical protein [Sphingomonas sp. SRS2]KKC25789.1 hypothetical protein WP12_12080 [Sphingomonas sp. SRS2]